MAGLFPGGTENSLFQVRPTDRQSSVLGVQDWVLFPCHQLARTPLSSWRPRAVFVRVPFLIRAKMQTLRWDPLVLQTLTSCSITSWRKCFGEEASFMSLIFNSAAWRTQTGSSCKVHHIHWPQGHAGRVHTGHLRMLPAHQLQPSSRDTTQRRRPTVQSQRVHGCPAAVSGSPPQLFPPSLTLGFSF